MGTRAVACRLPLGRWEMICDARNGVAYRLFPFQLLAVSVGSRQLFGRVDA